MRKHHSMYVLLLVMIVMLSLHLPSVRAQDGWEVYTDEECGFAVSYPTRLSHSRGARYAPNLPANTLTFGSRSGVSDLTIVSMENDLALPLAALSSRAFGGHFGVFQRVSSEERMINGVSAIRVIHAQPEIEGVVVRYISTFLQREQWVYWLFTQIATEPLTGRPVSTEQEARLSNYEQIVSGFTLLSAGPQKQLFLLSNVPVPPEDGEIPNSITAPSATFVWPSTGYIGYIYGRSGHNAIDIWTNTSGTGNVGSKGNPVYAVADGTIYTIFGDSDGLPMVVGVQHASLGLWTWYWHMADEYNYVSYITPGLYIGQAVSPDTLLGYQGNRRWEGMYDVIVHLHFGVSNVARSENQYGIDPSPYFGLPLNWNDPNHVPWMYYVERPSRCCGCLPASCCSARTAQVNTFPTEISWGSSTISNRAPVPLCTASETCRDSNLESSAASLEPEFPQPGLADNSVDWGDHRDRLAETPIPEPTEIVPDSAEPAHAPAPALIPMQAEPEAPQRTPPASTSYRIAKSVFGSGGGEKNSTHYDMNSTQGQSTDLLRRNSASYVLVPGYWGVSSPRTFDYRVYLPLIVRHH